MNERTDAVLAAIDGALMDPEMPDGMRWSPEPETVKDPQAMPYDGELVPIPPQAYEPAERIPYGLDARRSDDALEAHVRARLAHGLDVPPELLGPPPPAVSRLTPTVQFRRPGGEWEDAVLGPDGWRPRQWQTLGTLTPESTATFHDTIREAVRADLHRRADRIAADARAALPRVTVSPRPAAASDVLVVEETGPGSVSVRRATPEEVGELLRDAYARFIEGVTPLVQQVGEVFRRFGDALRNAGWAPTGPPTTPEARRAMGLPPLSPADLRAAALTARRTRPTGPPVIGPEASRRPRAECVTAATPVSHTVTHDAPHLRVLPTGPGSRRRSGRRG